MSADAYVAMGQARNTPKPNLCDIHGPFTCDEYGYCYLCARMDGDARLIMLKLLEIEKRIAKLEKADPKAEPAR